jgi:hypothetical protein
VWTCAISPASQASRRVLADGGSPSSRSSRRERHPTSSTPSAHRTPARSGRRSPGRGFAAGSARAATSSTFLDTARFGLKLPYASLRGSELICPSVLNPAPHHGRCAPALASDRPRPHSSRTSQPTVQAECRNERALRPAYAPRLDTDWHSSSSLNAGAFQKRNSTKPGSDQAVHRSASTPGSPRARLRTLIINGWHSLPFLQAGGAQSDRGSRRAGFLASWGSDVDTPQAPLRRPLGRQRSAVPEQTSQPCRCQLRLAGRGVP